MPTPEEFIQITELGEVAVALTRYEIETPRQFHVPYEGSDPAVHAAFPHGFPPSYGSGIAFKGSTGGGLSFWCLTDRGPNGDGPQLPLAGGGTSESKLFPAPGFQPSIGVLEVDEEGARLVASMPIKIEDGQPASGLPLPQGTLGNSGEQPLFEQLRYDPTGKAVFHSGGIDSEAIAYDRAGEVLWVSDEYGPFLLKIDAANGQVLQRYAPGSGLPAVLAARRPNRGMEGMTFNPESGLVHAFLQSPLSDGDQQLERHAGFLRWIVFDPARGATCSTLAYPLDRNAFADGRSGNAKLGDMAAIGAGRFVVIEQGEGANGHMFNHLVLIDTNGASDISAFGSALERSSIDDGPDWRAIIPLRKTLLLDLNALGWVAEKGEGLALVDAHTLALTNDNDFGMKTRLFDASGKVLPQGGATEVEVDAAGAIVAGADSDTVLRVAPVDARDRPLTLWLLRFGQPLASFGV